MYDYVIVGAGSAGCVLAARLGEDPDVKVAVIEAGPPDDDPVIQMPLAFAQLWQSRFDWDVWSEPEPGLAQRRSNLPRGRVLGGSSSLNAMIYIRGNRADYDEWAAIGLAGWGYEDVLPYFKRAEDNERGESDYHGVGGPLTVSDGRSLHPLVGACIDAAVESGIERTDDHNGPTQEGAGWYQLTQRNGRRCSTAVAYLHPAVERGNVEVTYGCLGDTDPLRGRACGRRRDPAEQHAGGSTCRARGNRLCAGAYQSPQLLLLSGLGPADDLQSLGIEAHSRPPRRAQPPRPSDLLSRLPHRQREPAHRHDARERRALRAGRARTAHVQPCRGRCLHPNTLRTRGARHPVQLLTPAAHERRARPRQSPTTATPSARRCSSRAAAGGSRCVAPAARQAADPPQLPDDRGRQRSMIDGARLASRSTSARDLERLRRADFRVPTIRLRRRHPRLRSTPRPHRLPPCRNVCDGRGGRRRTARLRG